MSDDKKHYINLITHINSRIDSTDQNFRFSSLFNALTSTFSTFSAAIGHTRPEKAEQLRHFRATEQLDKFNRGAATRLPQQEWFR